MTWIERTYHRRRRQRSLSRLTPIEYETIMTPPASQAAWLDLSPAGAADPGDDCLRDVAEAVREAVRDRDIVARYGGEELVVILEDADLACAAAVAERVRAAVERMGRAHNRSGGSHDGKREKRRQRFDPREC